MHYSHTNRRGDTFYIRAAITHKGGTRYYLIKDAKAADLLPDVPTGFEVYENPADGKLVLRKKVTQKITEEERRTVEQAVGNLAAVNDYLVRADGKEINVYISQFNSIDGTDEQLSAEEARRQFGNQVDSFKQYDDYLKFELVSEQPRTFRVSRLVLLNLFQPEYAELDRSTNLDELAETYCQHLGRYSFFDLTTPAIEQMAEGMEPPDTDNPQNLFNYLMGQIEDVFEQRKQKKLDKQAKTGGNKKMGK